jgi:hypothetical protein
VNLGKGSDWPLKDRNGTAPRTIDVSGVVSHGGEGLALQLWGVTRSVRCTGVA